MQVIRELPRPAHEVMLDIGQLDWVTVYVVDKMAVVVPPEKRSAQILINDDKRKCEINDFLVKEFDVYCTMFPERR